MFYHSHGGNKDIDDILERALYLLDIEESWCCSDIQQTLLAKYFTINMNNEVITYLASLRYTPFLVQVNWYDKVYFIDNYPDIGRYSNYHFEEFTFDNWLEIVNDYILNDNNREDLSDLFNFGNVDLGELEWFRIYIDLMDFSIGNIILKLNKEFLNVVNSLLFLENNTTNWIGLDDFFKPFLNEYNQ